MPQQMTPLDVHREPYLTHWNDRWRSTVNDRYNQDYVLDLIGQFLPGASGYRTIDPEAYEEDPVNLLSYIAAYIGFYDARVVYGCIWNACARRDENGHVTDDGAVGIADDRAVVVRQAALDAGLFEPWLAADGESVDDDLMCPVLGSYYGYTLRNECSCGEWFSPDEECPDIVQCEHCGQSEHWDDIDYSDHLESCRRYCDCSICQHERYGDPGDDQGWSEEFPERPMEAPDGRRRFGIEVEYNSGRRADVVRHMLNRGVACAERSYTHEVVRYWKLVEDSSVTGGEVVSPIMLGDDDSIEQVLDVIRSVKDAGGITGSNCGMHVHIDCTDFNNTQLRTLATNLRRTQQAFEAFVADSRFNDDNEHVQRMDKYDWDEIEEWLDRVDVADRARTRDNRESASPVSRYMGLNFNSLLTYGSVEVRLLGHTLNTVKVRTWIRICQATFVASMRGRKIRHGANFIEWLQEYGDLDDWSADRYKQVVEARKRPAEWLVAA